MTRDELQAVLSESLEVFKTEIKAQVDEALEALKPEAPVEGEESAAVKAEDLEAVTTKLDNIATAVESLAGRVEETENTLVEALDKALDRVEALEKRAVRKSSLEGQEGEDGQRAEPTLKDAISAAMRGEKVEVR